MRFASQLGLAATFLLALFLVNSASGQSADKRLSIVSGTTLEMGVDTTIPNAKFSWVLTKDREFVTAQQTTFFQTRQTTPGNYTLDVSIASEDNLKNEFHSFAIEITDIVGIVPLPFLGSGSIMTTNITFDPPADSSKTISIDPTGGLVKIDASASVGVTRFTFDINGSIDADGDGNPLNDADNAGASSEQIGGPLYYYFLPSATPRVISLAFAGQNQTSDQYSINFTGRTSNGTSVPQGGSVPVNADVNGLIVRFSADVNPQLFSGRPVVYEWDFGDHRRSLLESPVHTYAEPGVYTATVALRDIQNGTVIYGGTTQVTVQGAQASSSSVSSEPSDNAGGVSLGSTLKIGFSLLLLLVLGLLAYFGIKKVKNITSGKLQQKLEEVEGKYFESEKKPSDLSVAPAPLQLKKAPAVDVTNRQEVIDREKKTTEFATKKEQPVAQDNGPAPAWLKQTPASTPPPSAPAPKPAPAPPAPKPTPAPAPVAPPKPVPPPAPVPAPAPVAPPKPVPPPPPAPVPTPAPAPKPVVPTAPVAPTPVPVQPKPEPQSPAPVPPAPAPSAPVASVTPKPTVATNKAAMTPEEREAERKRKKRQRYRHNKHLREMEAKANPPMPTAIAAPQEKKLEAAKPEHELKAPATDHLLPKSDDQPIAIIRADSLDDQ